MNAKTAIINQVFAMMFSGVNPERRVTAHFGPNASELNVHVRGVNIHPVIVNHTGKGISAKLA